jgi:alkylhydroperoxidase/carboxymuconolactone decarboxylase family protein YurZ
MTGPEDTASQADQKGQAVAPDQMQRFDQFYKSARHSEVLDERTAVLLHLGAAMALGCEP